jgi:aminopeptidase N
MRDATPKTIYLKDYAPPEFLVDHVDLYVDLAEEDTCVTATLSLRRNPESLRREASLLLDGEQLTLSSLKINGLPLSPASYSVSPENLSIHAFPDQPFELEIVTRINPKANTALEGLYLSGGMFCTQCEAQGFRRITYFPDRPDVMARYSTTLVANKATYPVLLANGNLESAGDLLDDRHWAKWVDPYRKPCYLFALVAGQLDCLEDHFITQSGRNVTLRIFAEAQDIDKCGHAMVSLRNAMRWDEENYGREYDLDLYMIVAVSHFNMGAMENKGLNIFNTKYVLARPDTATDSDYEHIEGVIGHEYFHNWTGNRITCRDWFQLSLKEGLTVFRDQEFSADRHSRPVKRIDEVNMLRTRQFAEDSGPLAHPVRPESFIEINNFYTLTVYEKGAEVVRMLNTLLGAAGFRKGTDLYFDRHDGEAVTCEDFVLCMEDANKADLNQFRRWYSQAGTPEVELTSEYDPHKQELEITLRQSCPPTPGQREKLPLHIPIAIGLLGPQGQQYPLQLTGESRPSSGNTRVLELRDREQRFRFTGLTESPVVSALRDFSAPIILKQQRDAEELAFLLTHDPDFFNRWDAGQQLATRAILEHIASGDQHNITPVLINAFREVCRLNWSDLSYLALLLTLPSEDYVGGFLDTIDPTAIHQSRQSVKKAIAEALNIEWEELYQRHHRDDFLLFDAAAIGRRRLKNLCLDYLSERNTPASHTQALVQFESSRTMTDRIAALSAIVNTHHPHKAECLRAFYQQWHADDLVVGKWFTVQATCRLPGALDRVRSLMTHPAFDMRMPNHVRSLIGVFSQSNSVNFHSSDGEGYEFLADQVIKLNAINPQIASRMLMPLTAMGRYDEERQGMMRDQLGRIMQTTDISRDVYELASKALAK